MNVRKVFRSSVIGLFLLELVASIMIIFFQDDQALNAAWEALPETDNLYTFAESHFAATVALMISLLIITIAGLIGVLLFCNWGRWTYLISTLLFLPITIFSGPVVYYGWEIALLDLLTMANGGLLSTMFLPPISNEFSQAVKKPT